MDELSRAFAGGGDARSPRRSRASWRSGAETDKLLKSRANERGARGGGRRAGHGLGTGGRAWPSSTRSRSSSRPSRGCVLGVSTTARSAAQVEGIDMRVAGGGEGGEDNVKYLTTLEKALEPMRVAGGSGDLGRRAAALNNIKMMHTVARYYNSPERMTTLFVNPADHHPVRGVPDPGEQHQPVERAQAGASGEARTRGVEGEVPGEYRATGIGSRRTRRAGSSTSTTSGSSRRSSCSRV